jgi:hypothetical protein
MATESSTRADRVRAIGRVISLWYTRNPGLGVDVVFMSTSTEVHPSLGGRSVPTELLADSLLPWLTRTYTNVPDGPEIEIWSPLSWSCGPWNRKPPSRNCGTPVSW